MERTMNWKLLSSGVAALRSWRILLLLFLSVTAAALPATLAFTAEAAKTFGNSPAGAAMMEARQPDAGLYAVDFMFHEKPTEAWAVLLGFGIFMVVLQQAFLTGGIAEFAGREPRPFFGSFFGACGRHFKHNLKLTAMFIIALAVVMGPFTGVVTAITKGVFKDAPPNSAGQRILGYAAFAIGVLLYAIIRSIFDMARVGVRYRPFVGTLRALQDGASAWIRAPFRIVGVVLFWLVIGAIVQVLLVRTEWNFTPTNGLEVLAVFLFAQLAILWRSAMRLAGYGSLIRASEVAWGAEERERIAAEAAEAERLRLEAERRRIAEEERLERERIAREEQEALAAAEAWEQEEREVLES
jgi:hypothetical protein